MCKSVADLLYVAGMWQGKSERSDWFFSGQDFAIWTISMEKKNTKNKKIHSRTSAVYFLFLKAGKFKTSMAQVPYNKLLTSLASSSCTGEYWPSVVFSPYCHDLGPIFPSTALTLG